MDRLRRNAPNPAPDGAFTTALRRLSRLPAGRALDEAAAHLAGRTGTLLAGLPVAAGSGPRDGALDGRLLEEIAARAIDGARGSVYTSREDGRILAAFALATAAARRGGPARAEGVALLLGAGRGGRARASLRDALDGLAILDPACGGGSLLVAAWLLAARVGARLRLLGLDVAPLAVRATTLRLGLLGAEARLRRGDALAVRWPPADVLLMNPPFLRHEALPPAWKERAARASGLSRQADLSAHLVMLALRRAPVCGLVLPAALDVSRSAAPLRAEAASRGGFVLSLRSRAAGSFAASVETRLAVWEEGARSLPAAEATVALPALRPAELVALARGRGGARLRLERGATRSRVGPRSASVRRLADVCAVRFGLKTGANAFFHLRPLGGGRYLGALAGEVRLAPGDVAPLLSGLRDAVAPEVARVSRVIFRPAAPSRLARAYVRRGEELGVHLRATCASRATWWRVVPGRGPAPVLYPAKVGTRAFAFHNREGLLEDKKWHALFPRDLPPWMLALLLSSSPIRLAVERGARQLTGAQAIADIDCCVLGAVPFPDPAAVVAAEAILRPLHRALSRDPVTTDLAAMLARPAQRELDRVAGALVGMSRAAVDRERRELLGRVSARVARAAAVRGTIARARR